jgi:hypothetical protein
MVMIYSLISWYGEAETKKQFLFTTDVHGLTRIENKKQKLDFMFPRPSVSIRGKHALKIFFPF